MYASVEQCLLALLLMFSPFVSAFVPLNVVELNMMRFPGAAAFPTIVPDVHSLHYDMNGDVVGFEWAFRDADINDRLPLPIRPDLSSTAPYDRQQSLTIAQSLIHDPAVVAPAPNMPNLQQ
jgi:hypothetical protein